MTLFPGGPVRGQRDPLDRYYTPASVAASLTPQIPVGRVRRILEPSVGDGAWVTPCRERWPRAEVIGIDLDPGAPGLARVDHPLVADFLEIDDDADLVIGNPPYRQAEAHVRHALSLAPTVAFLLRLAFLEGQRRRAFWDSHPAARVVVLSRRPSFTGRGTDSCAYGFFIWSAWCMGPTQLVHG